jgi:hypothetical protein
MPISSYSMGGMSVLAFTVKDPSAYEKQAYEQAIERARPIAEEIARRMKVQITGIDSVVSSATTRSMIVGSVPNPLEEIPTIICRLLLTKCRSGCGWTSGTRINRPVDLSQKKGLHSSGR